MARTEDPLVQKMRKFEEMLASPKGVTQKSIYFFFRVLKIILWPIVWPLATFTPLSAGGDYGRMIKLRRKGKFREAAVFGMERVSKIIKKAPVRVSRFNFVNDHRNINILMAWLLLDLAIESSLEMEKSEFDDTFGELIENLKIPTKCEEEVAKALCSMSRLAWKLGHKDASWKWVERAIVADSRYGYSYYLKGWLEIQLDKGNPVENLWLAVENDPDLLRMMRSSPVLADFPDFMSAVEARAKHAGIFVA